MSNETMIYRKLYAGLLRFYPAGYRERYSEQMLQTFNDLLREREEEKSGVLTCALWMYAETSIRIATSHLKAMPKRTIAIILSIIGLLLIPLVAMQFTSEVDWSFSDFAAMGFMLTIAGALIEIGARISRNTQYRIALAIAVFTGFTVVWVNLAVGIIGSEDNPANVLFFGVVIVGLIGAIASAFKARGMAIAAMVTAGAQFLVPIIAFLVWKRSVEPGEGPGIAGIFALNFFWVLLWLAAATLFKNAAEQQQLTVS